MDETSAPLSLASRPEVVALVTLIGGIIIARLASLGVGALLLAIDRQSAKLATTEESLIPPGLVRVSRVFVFWLLVAGSVLLALRVMGIGGLPELLNSVLGFMPKLFIAFSIIMAGHLLGLFPRKCCRDCRSAGLPNRRCRGCCTWGSWPSRSSWACSTSTWTYRS